MKKILERGLDCECLTLDQCLAAAKIVKAAPSAGAGSALRARG